MFSPKRLQSQMRISHCMGRNNLVQSFDDKKRAIRAGTSCCYEDDITLRSQGKISLCNFFLIQVGKPWQQLLQNQYHFAAASNLKFIKSSMAKNKINHTTGVHSGVFGFQLQQHLRLKKLCKISLPIGQLKINRLFQCIVPWLHLHYKLQGCNCHFFNMSFASLVPISVHWPFFHDIIQKAHSMVCQGSIPLPLLHQSMNPLKCRSPLTRPPNGAHDSSPVAYKKKLVWRLASHSNSHLKQTSVFMCWMFPWSLYRTTPQSSWFGPVLVYLLVPKKFIKCNPKPVVFLRMPNHHHVWAFKDISLHHSTQRHRHFSPQNEINNKHW